ncbi:MAG: SAM-dependent methyltransferase [Acidobacteria bacterium]|nr:MAG: SAM-dependent methyltransferase [Acidobacteriota bacterium]
MSHDYSGRNAIQLCEQYESVDFRTVHECWFSLLPSNAAVAVDLGCGSGRDANALANSGFQVLAVDSSQDMVYEAQRLHPNSKIEWLIDSLPELTLVLSRDDKFDLVLLSAVWMHLSVAQRSLAMKNLSKLCAPRGLIVISVRHPADPSRGMTEASCEEIATLALQSGLEILQTFTTRDVLSRSEVTWSFIVLRLVRFGTDCSPACSPTSH